MPETYDVIVVGGGTMGLGAARALAVRGARALVLEQFGLVHDRGSHSGQTRIIRQAYAESPDYVPLVQRSERIWLDLQQETDSTFFVRTGGLDLSRPGYTQARDARRACEEHHLPYEWLDGAEVRHRWPVWTIDDEWEACFSPLTGQLIVEPALQALATSARKYGATIQTGQAVRSWSSAPAEVEVRTSRDTYRAEKLIITAGAWSGDLLRPDGPRLPLTVLRKVVWWLAVADPSRYAVGAFPIFISDGPSGSIYGFPVRDGSGLKIADHAGGVPTSPDELDRVARDAEAAHIIDFARQSLAGTTARIVERAVCMYTMTPDHDFIVDRVPGHPNVVLAGGFSGHGFKFAPAIGEQLAALALDPTATPFPLFTIDRFA